MLVRSRSNHLLTLIVTLIITELCCRIRLQGDIFTTLFVLSMLGSLAMSNELTVSALRTHNSSKRFPHPYVRMRNLVGTEIGLAGVVTVSASGEWQMPGTFPISGFYKADRRHWIRKPTMEEVERSPDHTTWYTVLEESKVPTVITFQSGRVAVKGDLLGEEGPEVQALVTKHQPEYEEKA